MKSNYVMVDGIKTHYLEAGSGPHLILLHSGEFGACSEMSWELNIEAFSKHFHVLAPDFIGFGRSDKLRDFGSHGARMLRHISRFLEVMCVDKADFVANSIAGRFLCRVASASQPIWPIRRMVCISGAGLEPANVERTVLQSYDATRESMRAILKALFHQEKWWTDEDYLTRRHELSLLPGAWEVAAAARFKSPAVPPMGISAFPRCMWRARRIVLSNRAGKRWRSKPHWARALSSMIADTVPTLNAPMRSTAPRWNSCLRNPLESSAGLCRRPARQSDANACQ
jgi:pimeloyl-ACP methyl ester carboxylesterase